MNPAAAGGRSCCFTGHRIIARDVREPLRNSLREVIGVLYEEGFRRFYAGGALGFDTLAAETVLEMREKLPELSLIIVRPCADQHLRWRKADREVYLAQLDAADEVVLLSPAYWRGCMQVRNRYLVDHAELCVAFGRREDSGTMQTVTLALTAGIPVVNLAEDGIFPTAVEIRSEAQRD
ncbi:MAG: DUF1273 family protein [Clostridia bacterium]|nr:DUF1273 family protein [Clostridia bacterium]